MSTAPMHEASIPNPALQPFGVLIGNWTTTGSHPLIPGTTLHGRASFEWLENGAFLLWRSEIDEPGVRHLGHAHARLQVPHARLLMNAGEDGEQGCLAGHGQADNGSFHMGGDLEWDVHLVENFLDHALAGDPAWRAQAQRREIAPRAFVASDLPSVSSAIRA